MIRRITIRTRLFLGLGGLLVLGATTAAVAALDSAAAAYVAEAVMPTLQTYLATIDAFRLAQDSVVTERGARTQSDARAGVLLVVVFGGVATLVGLLLAWTLGRSITGPLGA